MRRDQHCLKAWRRIEAHGLAVGADREPASQRGGDVVGVALKCRGVSQQIDVQLKDAVRGYEARDVGSGARP